MNPLLQLLAAIAELGDNPTAEDVLAALADVTDRDQLAEMLAAARSQLDEIEAAGPPTDETLATLAGLALAVDAVEARDAEIATADETRAAEAESLAARIRGAAEGDEGEGDEGAAEGEGVETPPAEGEEVTPVEGEEVTPVEGETAPTAVAAGARPVGRRPRVSRVAARRPASTAPLAAGNPLPAGNIEAWGLTAGADSGLREGTPITNRGQLAEGFYKAWEQSKGFSGGKVKMYLARAGVEDAEALYGRDRYLGRDEKDNFRRIQNVTSTHAVMQSVTAAGGLTEVLAAGGICAPAPVRYDQPVLGTTRRPVRDDMLVRFGADRGGIRVLPLPVLEDVNGAVGVWTADNDIDPDDPAEKPCLVMTCPEEYGVDVAAITKCLQTGNFRARYFQEQVEAWMQLAGVNHARRAETRLLTSVGTASKKVTAGQVLGTLPDVLAALDHASAVIRSSNRLDEVFPLRWGVPFWLFDQIRTDEARRLSNGTWDEKYALADAKIRSAFTARNVAVTTFLDGETGQVFNRQGDGPVQGWPSTVVTYLYPAGTHLFLDGGSLDLGMVRDSTLNRTNDFQMFAETFEGHIMHGQESWRYVLDTCPDGSVSGTVEVDVCSSGS